MADGHGPVRCHFPFAAGAEADIARVVEIVFDKIAVVRLQEGHRAAVEGGKGRRVGLKACAVRRDGYAIGPHGAGWPEARGRARRARPLNVVDEPAAIIDIADDPKGLVFADGDVEPAFNLAARFPPFGEGKACIGEGFKFADSRLVGDQAHRAGL